MLDSMQRKVLLKNEVEENVFDNNVKSFLNDALEHFPDYFWTAPSSNGKYHPQDEHTRGGLVLHTMRVAKVSLDMVRPYSLNQWESDVIFSAALLHDSFARGVPPRDIQASDDFHPLYPRQQFPFIPFANRYLNLATYDAIMECVESHQGKWSVTPSVVSNKKLPTILQVVDYICSRTYVHVEV